MIEAGREDKTLPETLLQLYQYDFSEIMDGDTAADGRFEYVSLDDAWPQPGYHAYIVRVDGQLAGFALVTRRSHFTGDTNVTDMEEFFIMRKYRRAGVGREVATRLFDLFPGRWEVREPEPNAGATAFWRRVIGEYTGGRYQDQVVNDERRQGRYQSFDTSDKATA